MRELNAGKLPTIVACLAFVSCASTERVQTASGMPEVTINAKPERVKSQLISAMANNGYSLEIDTQYSLAFSKTMDAGQEFLTRFALGSAYSSQPRMRITYTLAPQGNTTRVIGHVAIDMQNAFGGQQGMSLDTGKAGREVQAMLEQLKSGLERGHAQSRASGARQVRATRSPSRALPSPSASPQQNEEEIQNPNVSPQ